jgi:hypothetical protein
MEDFDEGPLDLLEDDGDGVIRMCLFLMTTKKKMIVGVNRLGMVGVVS